MHLKVPIEVKMDMDEIIERLKKDDFVRVVRCKDCKHLVRSEGVCKVLSNNYEPPVFVDNDDFCSRGARMEDNDE